MKAHGQIRRSQIITTYGPGALIDLPKHSGIMGGLDTWPNPANLDEIIESRLSSKLGVITNVPSPRLYAPPPDTNDPTQQLQGIGVWRFPEYFIVQEPESRDSNLRSRRIVHRLGLDDKGRFDGLKVVATRFVRACTKGHVNDIDWYIFVHGPNSNCPRQNQLWLDEKGTSGDLSDLSIRCEKCEKSRSLADATHLDTTSLGFCDGRRPWLGNTAHETCTERYRLLIRTASNAYFPQVFSVLSLPERSSEIEKTIREFWDDMQIVETVDHLKFLKNKPNLAQSFKSYSDDDVLKAIASIKSGTVDDLPVKHVELEAILNVPEGYGDDVPIDENFHARRLPEIAWRHNPNYSSGIESVIQLHRLREVLALIGFTRFEAMTPGIDGEYDTDVERASIALEPTWFPAIENRGEGIFIQLKASAIEEWLERPGVIARLDDLRNGHQLWMQERKVERLFPGGPYILLHTLSHLLIQSVSMKCGYPASSIRERIYANYLTEQFGLLLYTGTPDSEGTLGGLVQQGRYVEDHLIDALLGATLCSNDPICSEHKPNTSLEKRLLQGASCHGCALIAETSCEMYNNYLDRALVVPILGNSEAAFFRTGL